MRLLNELKTMAMLWRVCLLHSSGKQFKGAHHFVEYVPGRHTQGTPVRLFGD